MVCKALDGLKVYEVTGSIQTSRIVLHAVLSTIVGTSHVVLVLKKRIQVWSHWFPLEYLDGDLFTPEFEQELKQSIKKVGGHVNPSGLFLSTTSQASEVCSKQGIGVNRLVLQLPRSRVPPEQLKLLDTCKCMRSIISTI